MDEWAGFYERLFNFREVRYFDIEGQATGVKSKAMTSPCGKIRIPINEEGNEKAGQIQEYLDRYHGEGIQHIAMGSTDLLTRWMPCRFSGVKLLNTSETYYELLPKTHPRPWRRRSCRRCSNATSWWTASPKSCCCRSSARTSLAPSFLSSSSARATTALARATSRPCSKPWSSTRCAAAC
jgi:hypothetical protein